MKIKIKHKDTGDVLHTVRGTLREANLSQLNLAGANLMGADLYKAQFYKTNLSGALFNAANLFGADLSYADLSKANFCAVILSGPLPTKAPLYQPAPLVQVWEGQLIILTMLFGANLTGATLNNAILTSAAFWDTNPLNRTDLHEAIGLEYINHAGPSVLDVRTLRASVNHLPDNFLQGVGYTSDEISNMRLFYGKENQFFSCFISHTSVDADFVDKLRSDLILSNVPCWHYRYDLRIGDYFREQISNAIKSHDKVIVVCSQHSLTREGVVEEIIEAMEYQDETIEKSQKKIFPIRLDDFVFSEEIEAYAKRQVARGEWQRNWLHKIRAIQMGDFCEWHNDDKYRIALAQLLRDLQRL